MFTCTVLEFDTHMVLIGSAEKKNNLAQWLIWVIEIQDAKSIFISKYRRCVCNMNKQLEWNQSYSPALLTNSLSNTRKYSSIIRLIIIKICFLYKEFRRGQILK